MLEMLHQAGYFIRQNPESVMIWIAIYAMFCVWLAFETGKLLGNSWIWFALFFFLPGISYVLLVVVALLVMIHGRRDYAARKTLIDINTMAGWQDGLTSEDPEVHSVTPFSTEEPESPSHAEVVAFVLAPHMRDKKLDELIEFEQWPHALNYAEKKIIQAIENHREGEEKIYREYERMIRLKNRTLKIEDEIFPEIWTDGANSDQSNPTG
jgi:hypothetical protein